MRHLTIMNAEDRIAAWRREMADIDRTLNLGRYSGRTLETLLRRRQKLPRLIYDLSQTAGLLLPQATFAAAST